MYRLTTLSTGVLIAGLTLFAMAEDSPRKISEAKSIDGAVVRASSIAGMVVKDAHQKDMGKVEDVVIDMQTGHIRYAAISFGGFLGFGDKLFAVPFKALHVRHESGTAAPHFEMKIDQKMLENAKGFDKKNWPNFADPRFSQENDRHFLVVEVKTKP